MGSNERQEPGCEAGTRAVITEQREGAILRSPPENHGNSRGQGDSPVHTCWPCEHEDLILIF